MTTTGEDYTLSLTGSTNAITNAVELNNTGLVTLGDGGGDTFALAGGLSLPNDAASSVGAAITTEAGVVDFGAGISMAVVVSR